MQFRQSRWPYGKHTSRNRWLRPKIIVMSDGYGQTNGEFLSLSPNLICWDRLTSLHIVQPFNSTYLRLLVSEAINLRVLSLEYLAELNRRKCSTNNTLIDVINDKSLCDILTSNGLR